MVKREHIPARLRHEVFKRDNYRCRECGATNKETTLEIDHIVPVSKGGSNDLSNLQTLCNKCNRSKHTRTWVGGKTGDTSINTNYHVNSTTKSDKELWKLNEKQRTINLRNHRARIYRNNDKSTKSKDKLNEIPKKNVKSKQIAKKCPNCGTILNKRAKKCVKCNYKLSNVKPELITFIDSTVPITNSNDFIKSLVGEGVVLLCSTPDYGLDNDDSLKISSPFSIKKLKNVKFSDSGICIEQIIKNKNLIMLWTEIIHIGIVDRILNIVLNDFVVLIYMPQNLNCVNDIKKLIPEEKMNIDTYSKNGFNSFNFKKCSKCSILHNINYKYCSNCGNRLNNPIKNNNLNKNNLNLKKSQEKNSKIKNSTKYETVSYKNNYTYKNEINDSIREKRLKEKQGTKVCPQCGEEILNNALRCKYCNYNYGFYPFKEQNDEKTKFKKKKCNLYHELQESSEEFLFKLRLIYLPPGINSKEDIINYLFSNFTVKKIEYMVISTKKRFSNDFIEKRKELKTEYDHTQNGGIQNSFNKVETKKFNHKKLLKKCPGCGLEIKHDLHYCTTCGIDFNRFKTKNIKELKNLKKCPKCDTVNDGDAKKCIYCSFDLNFKENSNLSQKTASRYKRCPICGTVINRRAKKCIVCNNKFKNSTKSSSKKHDQLSINTCFKSSEEFMRSIKSDGVFLPCFIPNYYCDEKGNLKIKDNTIIKAFKKVKIYAYGIYVEKIFSGKTLRIEWNEISDIKISSNRLKISMDEKNIILINLPKNINVSEDILNFIPGSVIVNDVREKNMVQNKIKIDNLKNKGIISKIMNLFNR